MTTYHKQSGFYFQNKLNLLEKPTLDIISHGSRHKYLVLIYGVALYTHTSKTIKDILTNNNDVKCLLLKFYRNVSKETMINALEESISSRTEINNINKGLEKMKNIILSGNDLKFEDEQLKVITQDYYYSNVIAKASKTMFECKSEKNNLKSTGTKG